MHTPSERQQDAIAAGPPPLAPQAAHADIRAKRRPNWWLLGASGALLVVIAAFAILQFILKHRTYEDTNRLAKLEKAALRQPPPVATADWPQWRGPNRNGISG